jgi:hypothetical protein
MVIALIVKRQGFTFSYETLDGNRAGATTMERSCAWSSASAARRRGSGRSTAAWWLVRTWRRYGNGAAVAGRRAAQPDDAVQTGVAASDHTQARPVAEVKQVARSARRAIPR